MTYEEQLDDTIEQLQLKLEEAFNHYDEKVKIFANDFEEIENIPYKDALYSIVEKWKPLTGHLRKDHNVIKCAMRCERFERMMIRCGCMKYLQTFIPIIARGIEL